MARTVRDSSLETRTARLKLKPRRNPYWGLLETGLHLGYRRKEGSGTWTARRYLGKADGYAEQGLGGADDLIDADADGTTVKSFSQAQQAARAWWRGERRKDMDLGADTGPYTVAAACADYLKQYAAKGGKSTYSVSNAI